MPNITPGGHYLGRRNDRPDHRDRRFSVAHPDAIAAVSALPPTVDLRHKLPPVWDQLKTASCGPHSGDGLMCFLYPELASVGFSRLQIYYDVRVIEDDVASDEGVETRDVLATLKSRGAAPENEWPFVPANLFEAPPTSAYESAQKYKLASYSRLQTETDYLACLASGFPFILGFECPESIDSDDLARSGVMPFPQPSEKYVGGHDVLCVGYDLDFKNNDVFKRSKIDPARVSDRALLLRNSWGNSWSHIMRGHWYAPIEYMSNPSTGGDCWSGRR